MLGTDIVICTTNSDSESLLAAVVKTNLRRSVEIFFHVIEAELLFEKYLKK